jgi:hypothetical protein
MILKWRNLMSRALFSRKIKETVPHNWQVIENAGDIFKVKNLKSNHPHWFTYLEEISDKIAEELKQDAVIAKVSVYRENGSEGFRDYYLITEHDRITVLRLQNTSGKNIILNKREELLKKYLMGLNEVRLFVLTGVMELSNKE